jgi:hypothetical protein
MYSMRRAAIVLSMLARVAIAQALVPPGELARLQHLFEPTPGVETLRCDVTPRPPSLNFAFRFQAGYTFHVPQTQYANAAEGWRVLTVVTPENGAPTYLYARTPLSDASRSTLNFDIEGSYFLGIGRYSVESTILDGRNHFCRKEWQIVVAPSRADRAIPSALPPNTVRDFAPISPPDISHPDATAPMRITVLLNAASFSPHRTIIRGADRDRIADALMALLEHLPTIWVRLVVFSLEQQKEVLRADPFEPSDVAKVDDAISALPQATVDVGLLKNPLGYADFLAGLVRGELTAGNPADTVIFLGPTSRYSEADPKAPLPTAGDSRTRFFYIRYEGLQRPPTGESSTSGSQGLQPQPRKVYDIARGTRADTEKSEPVRPIEPTHGQPDIINKAVARLNGKSILIFSPAGLAAAIRRIEGK